MEEKQKERLYYLLPTIYRIRDTAAGRTPTSPHGRPRKRISHRRARYRRTLR